MLTGVELPNELLVLNWEPQPGVYRRISATVREKPTTLWGGAPFGEQVSNLSESAYARIIRNAVRGDLEVFPSLNEIEQSWRIVDPVLERWRRRGAGGLGTYQPGHSPEEINRIFPNLPEGMRWDDPILIGGG